MSVCLSEPSLWTSVERDEVFAELRAHAPVTWHEEPPTMWSSGGRGYWAVVRHADVRHVSRRSNQFVSGLGTELFDLPIEVARSYSGMLNMDDPEHTRFRAYVTAAFSARSVGELEASIRSSANDVIDGVCEAGHCDFAKELADPFPTAVICDLLSVPPADRAAVARMSRSTVPLGDPDFGGAEDALRAADDLIEYGKRLRRERLDSRQDDLMTCSRPARSTGNASIATRSERSSSC